MLNHSILEAGIYENGVVKNMSLKKSVPVLIMTALINYILIAAVYAVYARYIARPYGFTSTYCSISTYYREIGTSESSYEDAVYPEPGQFYHDLIETGIIDPSVFIYVKDYQTVYMYESNKNADGIAKIKKGSLYASLYPEDTVVINGKIYTIERCDEWIDTEPNIILPACDTPPTLVGSFYLDDMTQEEYETVSRYFSERGYIEDTALPSYYSEKGLWINALTRGSGYLSIRVAAIGLVSLFLSILFLHRFSLSEYRIHFDYGGTPFAIALHTMRSYVPVILAGEIVIPAAALVFNMQDPANIGGNYPIVLPVIAMTASVIIICGAFLILFPWDQVKEGV